MIKTYSLNPTFLLQKLCLVLLIFLAAITDFVKTDSGVLNNTIDVYKCRGSKLTSGFLIPFPSYSFDTFLRIETDVEFLGCPKGNLEEANLLYTNITVKSDKAFPSLNPQGILDVDRHYYDPDEYCVFDYTLATNNSEVTSLKLNYCPSNCSRSGINGEELCIRKCCGPGQVLDFRNSKFGCESSGNKSWYPTFYDPNFSRSSISKLNVEDLKRKPHFFKESIKKVCNGSFKDVCESITVMDTHRWALR